MDCLIKRIIRHICCLASQIEVVFCTNFLVKFVNVHVIFALGHRARCKFLASLLVAANFGDFGGDGDSPRSRKPTCGSLCSPESAAPNTSSRKPAGPILGWKERLWQEGVLFFLSLATTAFQPQTQRVAIELGEHKGLGSSRSAPLPKSGSSSFCCPQNYTEELPSRWDGGHGCYFTRNFVPNIPSWQPYLIPKPG